ALAALVLGFVGATALFYMGIGLYSRGNTDTGILRTSAESSRKGALYRTASVVSALAAVGALIGFGLVTARDASLLLKAVFGVVFLYNLPVSIRLWQKSTEFEGVNSANQEPN
ncbi:MAG: hypothetical protein SXQ77_00120, partial [Halobacteria archaeon]|nr:hypothetical protein [Halobacteria archaeon]